MKKLPLKKYTDFLVKETETLLNIDSPTGYTEDAAAWVLEEFRKLGFPASLTNKGGVLVSFGGENRENGLLLEAHLDTLGGMVAEIKSSGRLRLMKKTAILLNVGRGSAIVTEDLLRVMKDGHLRAACLDVMDPEPLPKGHPLWTAPRVYITPHISGGYRAGVNYDRVIDAVIRNLTLVLQGQPPVHTVDRELGY